MNKELLEEEIKSEITYGLGAELTMQDICDNIFIEVDKYANQRVIEELMKIRGIGITYTDDAIDKRIEELKQ